jgi:hypothetical protein
MDSSPSAMDDRTLLPQEPTGFAQDGRRPWRRIACREGHSEPEGISQV